MIIFIQSKSICLLIKDINPGGGGEGGISHMKGTGMLVVGCSVQNAIIFSRKGLF